jgi:hypothetical protein
VSTCELPPGTDGAFDPVRACIESGQRNLLIDREAMPAEFFDLSTGVAGRIVQQLTMYGIRMAAVVPDPSIHSGAFQDFCPRGERGRRLPLLPGPRAGGGVALRRVTRRMEEEGG